jgi:hypothetical protein
MWLILVFALWPLVAGQPPAAPALDRAYFKTKIEPLFLEKRPGHARCVVCHAMSTAFRLQPLPHGASQWTDEQTSKNFEAAVKFVAPGRPEASRLLLMPLAHEAGGTEFHPGGKHWMSRDDPEWKTLAAWVNGAR